MSGQFGPGGDFEGFRYATEVEVINLINNNGFTPMAVPNGFSLSNTGQDPNSGLVMMLGITNTSPTAFFSIGITSTITGTSLGVDLVREVEVNDADGINGQDLILSLNSNPVTSQSPDFGSYLVKPVPEPGSLALGISMCGIGMLMRRRNPLRSSH